MIRVLARKSSPAVGLGCMGLSEFYSKVSKEDALNLLNSALDIGYRHFDTADMYGLGSNEQCIGEFLSRNPTLRSELIINTKVGIVRNSNEKFNISLNGTASYIHACCDASLQRLNTDYIDIYYLHRFDPRVDPEESLSALAELVKAGKIRGIGVCEITPELLTKAHDIHPISAVQSEYSLWCRDVEASILPLCKHLNIDFVAFSPLGRGFLAGAMANDDSQFSHNPSDLRNYIPRFNQQNLALNRPLFEGLSAIATELDISVEALSLAWLLSKYDRLHVIPGSSKDSHIRSNFNAAKRQITPDVMQRLETTFTHEAIHGSRLPQK